MLLVVLREGRRRRRGVLLGEGMLWWLSLPSL